MIAPRSPLLAAALCALIGSAIASGAEKKPRARDIGLAPGVFPPGPLNAITDVAGVKVGHTTVIEGDNVRTGVTAILPHGGNLFQDKVAGAVYVGNAFGKLAGSTQVVIARGCSDRAASYRSAMRRMGSANAGCLVTSATRSPSR